MAYKEKSRKWDRDNRLVGELCKVYLHGKEEIQ